MNRPVSLDGVLLSHAHLDHSGNTFFLDPEIPVSCSAVTAFVSQAIQDTGQADFEAEVCHTNEGEPVDGLLESARERRRRSFVFLDGIPYQEAALGFWNSIPSRTREPRLATIAESPDRIGTLPVRYFPVEYSIFGACAFGV